MVCLYVCNFRSFSHVARNLQFRKILQNGLVVTHSAAGAKGPGLNSRVARAYLRFNSRASTPAGKQCLAMRCTVERNCDRIMQCS